MAWLSLVLGLLALAVSASVFRQTTVEAVAGAWLISLVPAIPALLLGVLSFIIRQPRKGRFRGVAALMGILLSLSPGFVHFYVWEYPAYQRRADPCRYGDRATLAQRYPELGSLLKRQEAEEDALRARHKTLLPETVYENVTVFDLEAKRATVTEAEAREIRRQYDELLELYKDQIREFRDVCRRVTYAIVLAAIQER